MGYLDDLHSIASSVQSAKNAASQMQHKSIARGALDGTLQFPNLVSDAIPVDMAATVTRTLERVYASFVQTYFSLNSTIDISIDQTPSQYLKRFHHNIRVESTIEDLYKEHCIENDDEYNDMMSRIYDGTTKAYVNEKENKMILFNFTDNFPKALFEKHRETMEESLKDIDFLPFPYIGNSSFYEAPNNTQNQNNNKQRTPTYGGSHYSFDIGDDRQNDYSTSINVDYNLKSGSSKDTMSQDLLKDNLSNANKAHYDMQKEIFKMQNSDRGRVPQMTDNDAKKLNDLQPYLMQVRLMAVNDQKEFVQFMDFIVGVKVVLHNIKSDEMIANIQAALQNQSKLFNLIRWTTGEKSLVKDLLLHINDVRLDIANRSKGSSPWWLALKRMKNTSKAQGAFFSRTKFVPNSTITISSYDVDVIKRACGFDLRNPKIANKLMESLFLMNFIIIDEGTRTVDILYDRETSFQTYALETFEREVSMNSNKLGKELTRMISR